VDWLVADDLGSLTALCKQQVAVAYQARVN
jgi:hypothetical protein